jgi:membrane-associated phospholipid phosphatase
MASTNLGVFEDSRSSNHQTWRNVLIGGAVFFAALGVALVPGAFDRPVTALINSWANHSRTFDLMFATIGRPTFSGAVLISLLWAAWFDTKDTDRRARMLVGTLASFGAGLFSRLLQKTLSTHPRPYYDPDLNFHRPFDFDLPGNTWDSFPSDHVAVFAGLVVVLYIARSKFAVFAIVWTALAESTRTYIGAHYPSDLVAGAALAATVVWAVQAPWPISLGQKVMRWEKSSPSLFYLVAFFASYQIASLFGDIRYTFNVLFNPA